MLWGVGGGVRVVSAAAAIYRAYSDPFNSTAHYLAVREDGDFFYRKVNTLAAETPDWQPTTALLKGGEYAIVLDPNGIPLNLTRAYWNLAAIMLP